jgi:hypothetical protein
MNTPEQEQNLMVVIEEILDMLNNCIENKVSEELEMTLGDENMGDTLILQAIYVKNKNADKKVLN